MQEQLTSIIATLLKASPDLSGLDAIDLAQLQADAIDANAVLVRSDALMKWPERLTPERFVECVKKEPYAALRNGKALALLVGDKDLFLETIQAQPKAALAFADKILTTEQAALCEGLVSPAPITKEEAAVLTLDKAKLYAAIGIETIKIDLGLVDKPSETFDPPVEEK